MKTIEINKTENRGGHYFGQQAEKKLVEAEVEVGDFVRVRVENGYHFKGTVTKITQKTITVTSDYGTKYANSRRFRISTFIRDFVRKE